MFVLSPDTNPLIPGVVCPGLLPIRFGLKAYVALCREFDRELADLEARYPAKPRVLTLNARNKPMRPRPK